MEGGEVIVRGRQKGGQNFQNKFKGREYLKTRWKILRKMELRETRHIWNVRVWTHSKG